MTVEELLNRVDAPATEVPARNWAMNALMVLGDLEGAKTQATAALAPAERLRHRTLVSVALWANAPVAYIEGDWKAGRNFTDRGLAVAPQEIIFLCYRALIEYQVGDFRQGGAFLEQLVDALLPIPAHSPERLSWLAIVIPKVAHICGVAGRLEVAQAAAQAVLSSRSILPLTNYVAGTALGLMAVLREDAEVARVQYERLKSLRGAEWHGFMSSDHLLGLLAQTTGNLDQALAHSSRTACPSAAVPATDQSWRGPATTTLSCCSSGVPRATPPRLLPRWKSPGPFPVSWACAH